MMNITMFDCAFGDCFELQPKSGGDVLYVDFGTKGGCKTWGTKNSKAMSTKWNKARYDRVYEQIVKIKGEKDLLLTHYHEDHYDGLVYAIQNKEDNNFNFRNIYIPDVWSMDEKSIDIVGLILHSQMLEGSLLEREVTLYDLFKAIFTMKSKLFFVSTDSEKNDINEEYTILWPNMDKIDCPKGWISQSAERGLDELARRLIGIVTTYQQEGFQEDNSQVLIEQLEEEKEKFRLLQDELSDKANGDMDPTAKNKLRNWGNEISIVFHSKMSLTINALFCGDVPTKYWEDIVKNIEQDNDRKQGIYDIIKVPHHGTEDYYWDFTQYAGERTFFLIPNGYYSRYPIYNRYSVDINYLGCTAVCVNNDNCQQVKNGRCMCENKIIIGGRGKITIREKENKYFY